MNSKILCSGNIFDIKTDKNIDAHIPITDNI